MLQRLRKRLNERIVNDPYGALALIVRLLASDGLAHRASYAIVLFWMAIAAACTAASAYLIGHAINEAYVNQSFTGIAAVALAIIFIFSVKGMSSYAQAVLLAKIGNAIGAEHQRRILDKLLQQNLLYFGKRHSSEFVSRVAFGSGAAANVLRILITTLGRDVMTLLGLAVIMIVQAPVLSLIGFLAMMPSFLIVRHLIARVRNITRHEFAGTARVAESLQETMQGLRVVKALNLEDEMRRRVAEDTRSVERAANKLARVMNRSAPMMETLAGIAIGLVLIYGGYQVLILNSPPGQYVSFIAAFLLAYEPGKRVARLNVDLSNALAGVQVLFEIFNLPDQTQDKNLPRLKVSEGRIEFNDVTFEYHPNIPVLRGLSFLAKAGQITALVGPSGGGKSTIFNLLLRFYDVECGEVLIDGQNTALLSQASVRSNIAYVGQDIFLFSGSVKANIGFGRRGATEDDIIAAAKSADAHEFIMELPQGYDTSVGEHGMQLSGGQRQRIAVARALIRDAPIILLDEPTANLDSESELQVQTTIKLFSKERTTLVIAHRLNTIRQADIIHVVENGMIVESGNHDILLHQGGRYSEFYNLQFAGAERAQ